MNKDVIYIEPDDDITDIISKLRASRSKVVALVPPKKIGVLRSAVNTKLISKAAKSAKKVVVIVTTDSSLVKLSASAGIPVAKSLSSRPKLPSEISEEDIEKSEPIEEKVPEKTEIKAEDIEEKKPEEKKPETKPSKKKDKKDKKKSDESKKDLPFFQRYKKWIIFGSVGAVFLILLGIWAFAIAPAVKISVQIRTTSNNFSEAVSFTSNNGAASAKDGKFLLESKEYKQENAVTFEATGKKDVGEKATGLMTIEVYVPGLMRVYLFQPAPSLPITDCLSLRLRLLQSLGQVMILQPKLLSNATTPVKLKRLI